MIIIIIIIIAIMIAILGLISILTPENNQNNEQIQLTKNDRIDYNNFTTTNYVMTQTELKFYRELKKVTDKLNTTIFPQVDLERIIKVKDNKPTYRNRIKSRSIDYTIVNNKNCKIICCIELDDYTHNRESSKKNDNFKNELFKAVNIPLYRIKVNNYYNLNELEEQIAKKVINE